MIYAFTSCALNYTPKSKALLRSLKEHAPDIKVCLALADDIREFEGELLEQFDHIYSLADIEVLMDKSWVFEHNIVELCTAIKPFVLRKILDREDCEAVFYFDPDMVLFSDINEMIKDVRENDILLTPHLTDPETTIGGIEDNELSALKHGTYNLGYVGVRNCDEGKRFATWWSDRLKNYCREDIPAGIFTDQKWIDLVPGFFDNVKILRHNGYNVASWNLTNRNITRLKDGTYKVNDVPLVFYHFTGFDSGSHVTMANRYASNNSSVKDLVMWYTDTTAELAKHKMAQVPWAYANYDDGTPIMAEQRIIYRQRPDLKIAFPNPFQASGGNDKTFKSWWQKTGKAEYSIKESSPPSLVEITKPKKHIKSAKPFFWQLPSKLYKFCVQPIFRRNVKILISNTYRYWGLKGVIKLFLR